MSYSGIDLHKVDSVTLATLLRLDAIPQAHKISRNLRDLRDVMRARLRLVQKRTSCCVSIHNLAANSTVATNWSLNNALFPRISQMPTSSISAISTSKSICLTLRFLPWNI